MKYYRMILHKIAIAALKMARKTKHTSCGRGFYTDIIYEIESINP